MPKQKLKSALANQQHNSARAAAIKRAKAAEEAKRASVKASLAGGSGAGKKTKKRKSSSIAGGSTTITAGVIGKGKEKERKTIPFDSTDSILLIGEGNFSFTLSLFSPSFPNTHKPYPTQVLSTAYDDEQVTYKKYPDAEENVNKLREIGVRVEFGVDAQALEKTKAIGKGRKWSRIIFNFPHVGAGITDQDRNILSNQNMILRFFRSAESVLTEGPSSLPLITTSKNTKSKIKLPKMKRTKVRSGGRDSDSDDEPVNIDEDEDDVDEEQYQLPKDSISQKREFTIPNKEGTILITLLNQPPYSLWSITNLASKPPTFTPGPGKQLSQPRYRLLRSFDFDHDLYQGYAHRRTIGFKEGISKSDNEEIVGRKGKARTWEFARYPKDQDQD